MRRGAVGVEMWGVVKGAGPFPEKKSCLPPSDKFGYILIFDADFNSRKHGQSIEALHATRILRFNRETKFTKQCKDYPKIHGLTTIAPPPA